MNHKQIILTWLLVILGFVIGNWYVIAIRKKHPDYKLQNIAKIVAGFVFLVLAHFDLLFIPFGFFSFGALFDPGLNIMRGKSVDYLGHYGNSASTDKWEVWLADKIFRGSIAILFFVEFIVAMLFTGIYYTGWAGFVQQLNGTYDWSKWLW